MARERGTIAGLGLALRVFELLDDDVAVGALASDGDTVEAGTRLATVRGSARTVLSGERLALNLLGQLSGVATSTRALVDAVEGTGATVYDTRKTTPLLRRFQKMAVVSGGGANHRMGLYDQVLIKDNHIASVGSAAEAVRRARDTVGDEMIVEVEIDHLEDLESVIEAGADVVLLDNMGPERLREAVRVNDGRVVLEASGGVTADSIRAIAESGVDRISVGAITHSAPSLDVAMDFEG